MKHELFEMTREAGGDSMDLRGEVWVADAGNAIVCIDYGGYRSKNFFERNLEQVMGTVRAEIGVAGKIDIYEEVKQAHYWTKSGDLPYSEVARRGYQLLGLEEQVFPPTGEGPLISEGKSTFDLGESNERLEADSFVWTNNKQQGLVLLNFPPDEKWRRVLRDEPFALMVEAHFGLRRGATIVVANCDDPELGTLYVPLEDYVDGKLDAPQHTYAWAKAFATPLVHDALGIERSEPLELDFPSRHLEPELEL